MIRPSSTLPHFVPDRLRDVLFVSDLDGTLLTPEHSLHPTDRDALNAMIDGGLQFTIASARSIVSMREVCRGLRLKLPVIELNGAFLSEYPSGQHLHVEALEPNLAVDVYRLIEAEGHYPFLSTHSERGDRVYINAITNPAAQDYVSYMESNEDQRLQPFGMVETGLKESVVVIGFSEKRTRLEPMVERLRQRYGEALHLQLMGDIYRPDHGWFTVTAPGANKGAAVLRLKERLFAGRSSLHVVTFGDGVNDVPLFAAADTRVAVANAIEPLRTAAHLTIGQHETGSVVKAVRDWYENVVEGAKP